MKKRLITITICLVFLLCGCVNETQPNPEASDDHLILVGFSQVGAESEWRVTNTKSMKEALSEENGYELIYDDARNEQEKQIRAIRTFIQQEVKYIVFSPRVETGWKTVLQEAKDAGIQVIVIDRYLEQEDEGLYTAFIGSNFLEEGDKAVRWLEGLLEKQERSEDSIRIVHIQGTIGSSAQIGRTAALDKALEKHPKWEIVAREDGDFTRAKAKEVMAEVLKQTKDIDVVYCENDGEALGAIDAIEKAGLKCNAEDGVIVISFDATRLGLQNCLLGKIALNIECNPLQGPYVDEMIKRLEGGQLVPRFRYINEAQFDYRTITQEMIDARGY